MLSKTLHLFTHNTANLTSEEQAMNGLYGMPETTIEDADHAVTDDLTSKINELHRKKPRKISSAFLTMHPLFVFLHSF